MQKARLRLIHLIYSCGLNRPFIRHLLKDDPLLENLYHLTSNDLQKYYLFPLFKAEQLLKRLHSEALIHQINQHLQDFQVLTIYDQDYPNLLKTIYDPPFVLFLAGDRSLLQAEPKLSVIGTRRPSKVAYEKVKFYLDPLLHKQWTIVSGLARGIDGFSHQVSLNNKGKTIAILGSGFYHIYPREHYSLYLDIQRHGLVISEYPPHVRPKRHQFPERNRLISGLSFGTLVIEAMERSGTFITVDQALEQGRQVFVAPGCPLLEETKGCHRLIQEGAELVLDAHDLLGEWRQFII